MDHAKFFVACARDAAGSGRFLPLFRTVNYATVLNIWCLFVVNMWKVNYVNYVSMKDSLQNRKENSNYLIIS